MPTAEGKQVAADLVARELKDAGVEEGLREAYPAFLELNEQFKALCGDWQLFPGDGDNRAPNDHTDAAYDTGGRRAARRARPLRAGRAASRSPTISPGTRPTGPRLTAARERVEAGDQKQFTGVMCGSYHDVWMELHQDLLLTLGIDRAEEGSY